MDILTLKSKIKVKCKLCNKCCIYRGDIKLTPINVCKISKFLKISIEEFLEKYTERVEDNKLEIVIKTKGTIRQCLFYDEDSKKCKIHSEKPMQCVMFPLVPENIKRDYFYNSGQCEIGDEEITVKKWLNGNNRIYSKNKNIYIEWIKFIEWAETKLDKLSDAQIDELYKILFKNYNLQKRNFIRQMRKNMCKVEGFIKGV